MAIKTQKSLQERFAVTSRNYFFLATEDYEDLPKHLSERLETFSSSRELMFRRRFFTNTKYNLYALNQHQGPFPLKDFVFVDAGSEALIKKYLEELKESRLPYEIRIIRANRGRPNLALFFSRD
jgi:hypothetical protein